MMVSQIIKEKLLELENSKQTSLNSRPKIQRVAGHLRNREKFKEHYTPKLVSIGPIHNGKTNLKLGEKYKLMWAAEYIKNTKQSSEGLYQKIAGKINELKGRFDDDVLTLTGNSLEGFGSLEEKLSWMLFVDGCFLLHILNYDEWQNIKDDQLSLVLRDVLLLENQLPYEVLNLLWKDNDSELIKCMMNFLIKYPLWGICHSQPEKEKDMVPMGEGEGQHRISIPNESESETPATHLLDLYRKTILTKSNSKGPKNSEENDKLITYKNIQDLRAVGIRLKASSTQSPIDIDFSAGWFAAELILPKIVVEDDSAATFLNLIAYEMCPDFKNNYEICSFVGFMDTLIDHPEDVTELRSKKILFNDLGSDKEVADLFNNMGTDMTYNPDIYKGVINKIDEHYYNKYKTWIALGFHTYFHNPWAIIAFLAAFIALALTFIQTWFAIHPASPSK